MNRKKINLSYIDVGNRFESLLTTALAALMLFSCRTTQTADHVMINSAQSDGLFYSTTDERTSLENPERTKDLEDLRDKLVAHVKANRQDIAAMGTLAQVHVALGNLKEAENLCRQILRKDLKNAKARKVLGQIALKRGQVDLALIHFANIGGTNSKDASVINMIAQIELLKGNNAAAMGLFKKAIRLDPNDHAARLNLSVLYIKHRQMALASVELERILKSEPNNLDAKLHLAIVMLSRQELEPAKEILESVLDIDKDNPLALYNLAVAYRTQRDYDEALDILKKYIASKRGKPVDNNQAFALIQKIQREQSAQGDSVSDEEIQEMASDLRNNQKQQKSSKASSSKVAAKSTTGKKAQTQPAKATGFYGSEGEDIEDLERSLK